MWHTLRDQHGRTPRGRYRSATRVKCRKNLDFLTNIDQPPILPGEGHHVYGQFPQVGVKLAGEAEAGGDTGHGEGDQVVQVAVGGVSQLESPTRKDTRIQSSS